MYHRSYAKIDVAKTFKKFSMKNSLQTFQITGPTFYGKTVHQPKYSETAWIHNPGLNNDTTITILPEENKMWHVMIEAKKVRKVKNFARFTNEKQDDNDFEKYTIEKDSIEAIEESFVKTFKNFTNIPKNNNAYTEILYNCFKKHEGWDGSLPCFTPLRCKTPKSVPNFKCKVAQRDYKVRRLADNIMLYLSKNPYSWKSSDNGCQLLRHN
uniref:Uncharacterized protein n=1 Tax=Panagrolaimus davidi TaxID=227884 RepID=A0A914QA90_9BILA